MRFLIIILVSVACASAKAPKPKKDTSVPVVRLLYPSGKDYACAVPVGDKLITAGHANAFAGQTVHCAYKGVTVTRIVLKVVQVKAEGISAGTGAENRGGDLTVLTLESPLPYWVARQTLGTGSPFGLAVKMIQPDGIGVPMVVLPIENRRQSGWGAYPDGVNPRWLIFGQTGKGKITPGVSGGAITKGRRLVSIVSRANAGPNLSHKDVQAALLPALQE